MPQIKLAKTSVVKRGKLHQAKALEYGHI